MIDQGEIPQQTEQPLTPEQIAKTDADLTTLSSLTTFAQANESVLEVTGGYAVESHFGGRITRPHGDIDAVLWIRDASFEQEAQQNISDIFSKEETNWQPYDAGKNKEHFIEFREDDPSKKEFKDRRRIELYTFDKAGIRTLRKMVLVDSKGEKHEVMVAPIEMTVANIIRIINRPEEERIRRRLRETNDTDRADLKKLISHPKFSKNKYLQTMASYLVHKSGGSLTEEQAIAQAESMWTFAINQSSQPNLTEII